MTGDMEDMVAEWEEEDPIFQMITMGTEGMECVGDMVEEWEAEVAVACTVST